jgi:ribosomal protein L24
VVLSGDSKGEPGKPRLGRVLAVNKKKWTVTVEKVNFIKRHTKARGQEGERHPREGSPLHISKVALWDAGEQGAPAWACAGAGRQDPRARVARATERSARIANS